MQSLVGSSGRGDDVGGEGGEEGGGLAGRLGEGRSIDMGRGSQGMGGD